MGSEEQKKKSANSANTGSQKERKAKGSPGKKTKLLQKKSGKDDGGTGKPGQRDPLKTIIMWVVVIFTVVLGLKMLDEEQSLRDVKITYSQFKTMLKNPEIRISSARVIQKSSGNYELRGEVTDPTALEKIPGIKQRAGNRSFYVVLPFVDSPMITEWDSLGFPYTFEGVSINFWSVLLSSWPIILLVLFWIFMFRQMQGGQKGIFSFGKSKAKIHPMNRPQTTFSDVAGVEEAKAELEEIIEFLKDPHKFKRLGGKIPKGVLLLGPPGTGKTLLARAVAGEAGVPFLSMSGSDFVEMFVGVGASRVRDLFDTAKRHSPSIIFIDEIDAVGRQRGAGLGGGHDEREQTLNQMLVEMDGFEENSGVILIAATNRPDVLDPALLRPGRFDRQVVVDIPDVKGREGILKVHVKNIPLAEDVDLYIIARGTPGFVGADLANLVNEAALMAARFGQEKVTMLDFEEAKDKVLMGVERKSMVLSEDERRTTAYHEAGHAICNLYCTHADPLHKVTIIPRGRALGVTFSLPGEDRHSHSKEFILDRICIMMGGRVAEELVFNIQTTGAANDIKNATELIRKLICDFGMTYELGPLSYGKKEEQIFLGREIASHRDYSDKTAEMIDVLMKRMVEEQVQHSRDIIVAHKKELDLLANALLEHEMLDLEEIKKVIKGEFLGSAKKTRSKVTRKSDSSQKEKSPAQETGKPEGKPDDNLPGHQPAAGNQQPSQNEPDKTLENKEKQ